MVSIAQMKALVMVSNKGSFSKAASELNISSAAISKQLILLEKELGLQLMTRTTRHVEFTEIGKSYCDQCRRILEEIDVAKGLVDQMKSVPQGRLKVVSGRYFASLYILPYLSEFLSLFPNIVIDIELAERLPNLEQEPVDLLIGMSIPSSGHIIQKKIVMTKGVFIASPNYLKKFGNPQVPQDLKSHRHIIHSMRHPANTFHFSNKETITVDPYISINDSQSMVKLAIDGLGIIKAHYPLVEELLQKKKLIEILPNFIEKEVPLYMAYRECRYVSSKLRCFIDFTLSKVKSSNLN